MANEVSGLGKTKVVEIKKFNPTLKFYQTRYVLQKESVEGYFNNFTQWANDRQIIQNGNILAQGLKLVSEVGELSDNLAKGRCIKDDVGDCMVVLNNLAQMQGLTLNECLEQAWNDIKDRKGYMNEHGVFIKEGDVVN